MEHYTIQFLGEGGVGKTCWIGKLRLNDFYKKYVATVGLEVHPDFVNTNYGLINLTFYDYFGRDEYAGPTKPMENVDATILMFDLSRKISYKHLNRWHEQTNDEPVFLVGNKNDLEQIVTPTYHTEHNLPYLSVNAKTGTAHDLLTPILRRLTGHDDLMIVD